MFEIDIKSQNTIENIAKQYTGEILFGVPKSTAHNRQTSIDTQSPYNNAEILALMERGSPVNNIPARPLLQPVINKHKEEIAKELREICVLIYANKTEQADEKMERLALRIEGWAKQFFIDDNNGWAPNSPITVHGGWMRKKNIDGTYGKPFYVKGKGSDRPLIDTGSLRQSIKAIFYKDGKQ